LAPRYIPTGLALSEKGFACHAKASALWRPSSPAGIANSRGGLGAGCDNDIDYRERPPILACVAP